MIPRRWWPPVMWAALILILTSIPSPPGPPGGIPHLDKVVHFIMYAGLGWLVARAMTARNPRSLALALLAIVVFAALDEWHQQFVMRDPNMIDWIADVLGAATGLLAASRVSRVESAS